MLTFNPTPFSLPLLMTAVISLAVAWLVWRRRPALGVYPFVVLMASAALWALVYALEIAAEPIAAKRLFAGIQYIGITLVPAAWFVFVLEYTGREKWLTRRSLLLLSIEPVIIVLLALTNMQHPLLYTSASLQQEAGYTFLETSKGIAFYVHVVYSYLLLMTATILLVRDLIRQPDFYRGQLSSLLMGTFAPWAANLLYVSGLDPIPGFDLTPVAFTVSGLAFAWSMVRFRMLDVAPVARDTIIASMGDGMLVLDTQGRIVDINPAARALINTPTDTLIGKPARQVLAAYQYLVDRYRDVQEARSDLTLEVGDRTRHFELRISPLRNRSGNLAGRVIVVHDVTELKQANQQISEQNERLLQANLELAQAQKKAEEASRLKSEFLATISHELRTPLNAIIGFSDLMQAGLTGTLTAQQSDYVARVLNNSERLLALINEILDVSKIEAGRMELHESAFAPQELLQNIERALQSMAERKSLKLVTFCDPALPPALFGDRKRLEQILTNLVGNAIRFTQTGQIDVRLERAQDAYWTITVTDTGIGIPAHALEYIFDEFRQVDGSTEREHGGTGLGLALVRRLSQLMGGGVKVESEVGRGSTFTVRLPLRTPDTPPRSTQATQAAVNP
jgi:PAS domain S-box-containing protein